MNKKLKWVATVVGAVALAAVFLVPLAGKTAPATPAVPAATAALTMAPRSGDFVIPATTSSPAPTAGQYYGNSPPQDFYNYMYGMMGYMMGGYWGNQGSSGNGQGNYPYYGMMGGYWGYPGGVSGNVYGQ